MLPKIYSFETRIKVDTSNLNLVAQSCDYFSNQSWCRTQQRPLMFSAIHLHDILQLRSTLLYEVSTVFQSVHFPYYGMNFTWLIERSFTHHKKPLTKIDWRALLIQRFPDDWSCISNHYSFVVATRFWFILLYWRRNNIKLLKLVSE